MGFQRAPGLLCRTVGLGRGRTCALKAAFLPRYEMDFPLCVMTRTTCRKYLSMQAFSSRKENSWWKWVVAGVSTAGAVSAAVVNVGETNCQESYQSLEDRGLRQTPYGITRPVKPGSANKNAILLLADIDGTLTGNPDGLRRFNDHWNQTQAGRGSLLVYNTARPRGPGPTETGYQELVMMTKGDTELMLPDVLMTAEGTEIYWMDDPTQDDSMTLDAEWDAILSADWNEEEVVSTVEPFDQDVWLNGMEISIEDKFRYAISVATAEDAAQAKAALEEAMDMKRYKILSFPMHWHSGWLVTVLPRKAGKCEAAKFIATKLGFCEEGANAHCSNRVVWAGDSENDIGLLSTPIHGIVVGNRTTGLFAAAKGKEGVFFAQQCNAEGVLEGLEYYGLM